MLDTYIFRLAKIDMGIFRSNGFSSGRLLLELVLFESIHIIAMVGDAPSEDKAIIVLAPLFVGLSLYVVNGKQVPSRHCDVCVWSTALLLIYLIVVSVITKMNIMAESVLFVLLVLIK